MAEKKESHFSSLRSSSSEYNCKECDKKLHKKHKCPVCQHYFCEDHIYPEDHKCRVKSVDAVNIFKPIHFFGPIIILIILGVAAYAFFSNSITLSAMPHPTSKTVEIVNLPFNHFHNSGKRLPPI